MSEHPEPRTDPHSVTLAGSWSVDDLFRDIPVQTARDLVSPGIFEDDEVDELIAHVHTARRAEFG